MRLEHILKDAELNEEITRKLSGGELAAPFASTATTSEVLKGLENARSGAPGISFQTETIVRRMGRPVVLVRDNTFEQPQTVSPQQRIVVLGYPAKDSRVPDQTLMEQIYGSVYDVKRLAPGEVMDVIDVDAMQFATHDCTTLGGNSGSVAFEYTGGQAVGLHFGGSYLKANYAVPASVVAERLAGRVVDNGHV